MFKFEFSKQEVKDILDKIYLNDFQQRILEYRILNYSLVKMSDIEHCSQSTISRELRKINNKIKKII